MYWMVEKVMIFWGNELQRRLCCQRHSLNDLYWPPHISSLCVVPWHYFQKHKRKLVEPMSKSASVINPDFFPCPFLYVVVVVITIIQQRQALSVKAWCSFPSICLRRWRAFPPYLVWPFFFFCLKMPVGLNCSNALSYELPALSLIYWICCPIYFLSKINSKKSAGFHHPKGSTEI